MKFSIFIPTYNASNYLESLIPVLKKGNCENKIFIIDSSSTDGTTDILNTAGFNNITLVSPSDFDHGGTRSLAREISEDEIVVFLTQDALPFSFKDIENLIDVFKNKDVAAAYGRQISYKNTNLFGKHLREFNYPEKPYVRYFIDKKRYGIKCPQLSNSFAAYRRDAMDKIGWFKEGLILGEDVYAGAKLQLAGYALAYVADAKVYHSHSYSPLDEFKRYFDIGVFHKMESWIIKEFDSAEGEGLRYIKSELSYIFKNKGFHLIPEFFIRNLLKYLGYKLGQNYEKLPRFVIKKISMHHRWWDKHFHGINNLKY